MNDYEITTLSKIDMNEKCMVVGFNTESELDVNRLFNFGLMNGSVITPKYKSIFGGTIAYLVKDSVIGIRKEDIKKITVRKI